MGRALLHLVLFAVAHEARPESSVTVMSFNIRTASQWASRDGGDAQKGRTWDRRLPSVAKAVEIGAAHVVGTQEGLGWQVDELAAALGPSWRRVGGGRVGDASDDDETASILYDGGAVELLATGDYWLSATPERSSKAWGAALPRVVTWATFRRRDGGGERFSVVNAHFDHASVEARTRSASLVRDDSAARFARDAVVFLTGDFNAIKEDAWYGELAAPAASGFAFVDAWPAAAERSCGSCPQVSFHDWMGAHRYSKQWLRVGSREESLEIAHSGSRHIDAVFVSRSALAVGAVTRARLITDDKRRAAAAAATGGRAAPPPFASDHYPVVCTFAWGRPPPPDL